MLGCSGVKPGDHIRGVNLAKCGARTMNFNLVQSTYLLKLTYMCL